MPTQNSYSSNQARSHQLSSSIVAPEFGEVNIKQDGNQIQVMLTILMEPEGEEAEGWQTGVALDVSASMRGLYGRDLLGEIPEQLNDQYEQKGWITFQVQDGKTFKIVESQAYEDAIKKGYLKPSENIVQPLARDFIGYLAELDADGETTVIYWAGGDGDAIEFLGDFTKEKCQKLEVQGPKSMTFGLGTILTPAIKYFVDRFVDAKRGMYIFITDGKLDDLEEVKQYTTQLAKQIQSGQRNQVKCVLIGVGQKIDKNQLEELDDLATETNIDIWDHKVAAEMRNLVEIFAEVVDENKILDPTGTIYDSSGNIIKKYTDGVPAQITFTIPANSEWFELEVYGKKIRQTIV